MHFPIGCPPKFPRLQPAATMHPAKTVRAPCHRLQDEIFACGVPRLRSRSCGHQIRDRANMTLSVSVILPAKNEAVGLQACDPADSAGSALGRDSSLIDDGSDDNTAQVAARSRRIGYRSPIQHR